MSVGREVPGHGRGAKEEPWIPLLPNPVGMTQLWAQKEPRDTECPARKPRSLIQCEFLSRKDFLFIFPQLSSKWHSLVPLLELGSK